MGIRSELDANFDFDILDEFYDHYSMMVESMEVIILDLSNSDMRKRSVDELFRIFHNIKSASGYLKIVSMNKLSSFVEDELEELRSMDKPVSQETIDWLLLLSDMFSQWNDDFKQDNNLSKIKYSLLKLPDMDK